MQNGKTSAARRAGIVLPVATKVVAGARGGRAAVVSGLKSRFLAASLQIKILGAGLMVATMAVAALLIAYAQEESVTALLAILIGAVLFSVAVNVLLVRIALRPVKELERIAERIWSGDLTARVGTDPVADREMARVGKAFNLVLDTVIAEQSRVRRLAGEVIRVGDRERAALGHELHDGVAQRIAAAIYELSALEQRAAPPLAMEVAEVRGALGDVLEELRLLAQSAHPRVLEDLGLGAALRQLGRHAESTADLRVDVNCAVSSKELDSAIALVIYRIAHEAVRNAVAHSDCRVISVRAWLAEGRVELTVADDGSGFVEPAADVGDGRGIFTMRERAALVGGKVEIDTEGGAGTVVRATIPVPDLGVR